jgi:hypothetical protein
LKENNFTQIYHKTFRNVNKCSKTVPNKTFDYTF